MFSPLLTLSVNACVLDHPKKSIPDATTSWCDFDPCYADGEVAARNPVDVKFNMVIEGDHVTRR